MAGMASPCSSSVLIKANEVGGNGALLAHYNGLRLVESISAGIKPRGFVSAPGNEIILFQV